MVHKKGYIDTPQGTTINTTQDKEVKTKDWFLRKFLKI